MRFYNGFAVVYNHLLYVFAGRIPTMRGYYIYSIPDKMLPSGSKPEVVSRGGSPSVWCDFSLFEYGVRLAQSVLTVGHTDEVAIRCSLYASEVRFFD